MNNIVDGRYDAILDKHVCDECKSIYYSDWGDYEFGHRSKVHGSDISGLCYDCIDKLMNEYYCYVFVDRDQNNDDILDRWGELAKQSCEANLLLGAKHDVFENAALVVNLHNESHEYSHMHLRFGEVISLVNLCRRHRLNIEKGYLRIGDGVLPMDDDDKYGLPIKAHRWDIKRVVIYDLFRADDHFDYKAGILTLSEAESLDYQLPASYVCSDSWRGTVYYA